MVRSSILLKNIAKKRNRTGYICIYKFFSKKNIYSSFKFYLSLNPKNPSYSNTSAAPHLPSSSLPHIRFLSLPLYLVAKLPSATGVSLKSVSTPDVVTGTSSLSLSLSILQDCLLHFHLGFCQWDCNYH